MAAALVGPGGGLVGPGGGLVGPGGGLVALVGVSAATSTAAATLTTQVRLAGLSAATSTAAATLTTQVRLAGLSAATSTAAGNIGATITGTTRDQNGVALGVCVVHAFRTSDDVEVAQTTSAADGTFSVTVAGGVAHYLMAYKAGSPDVAGTTVNTLTGN